MGLSSQSKKLFRTVTTDHMVKPLVKTKAYYTLMKSNSHKKNPSNIAFQNLR